jgi:hypothetical protein
MATPELVTQQEFTSSRYGQLVEDLETPINDVLARAEAVVQKRLGYSIAVISFTETFRARGTILFLRHRPIVTITSVSRRPNARYSWELVPSNYVVTEPDPGYIEVLDYLTGYEVQVIYTAGYASAPEDIKEAVIMQAVLLSTQDLEVYGAGDSKKPGYLYFNDDIDRLLMRYKQTATVWH